MQLYDSANENALNEFTNLMRQNTRALAGQLHCAVRHKKTGRGAELGRQARADRAYRAGQGGYVGAGMRGGYESNFKSAGRKIDATRQ